MTEEILSNGENLTEEQMQEFINIGGEETEIISDITSKEEFTTRFIELFDMAGDFWKMPDFKINKEKQFEVLGATVTAEKLYQMALKYPMLHFLVEPCGGWFGDAWLIGWFIYGKSNIVSRKIDGLSLSGRLKRLLKKGGEVTEKGNIFSKLFKKKEV